MSNVFDDGRLGCWIISPSRGRDRFPKLKAFGITDVFLPALVSSKSDLVAARSAGLFAHAWEAVDGRDVNTYAASVLGNINRLGPGAFDLNTEFNDDAKMEPFIRGLMPRLRNTRPNYYFRLNIAPRKGAFVPTDLVQNDPKLYVCEQNFFGNMQARYAEDEAFRDMYEKGVPLHKAAICYGAHVEAQGHGSGRFPSIPNLPFRHLQRGCIFNDDLLVDAGLI